MGRYIVYGGVFLLRVGSKLNDQEMIQDALNQYYWHIKYLQDPSSGLWYHGYNNVKQDHMSDYIGAEQMLGAHIPCRKSKSF